MNLPNKLTLLRFVLVPVFMVFMYIDGDSDVEMGDIVRVKVIQSDIYDLYAELV